MEKKLVVVSGFSKAGKTLVANTISNEYHGRVFLPKFASKVKRAVEAAMDLPFLGIDLYPDVKEKALPILLEAYDKAGWVQENLWAPAVINELSEEIEEIDKQDYVVVFDDVRRKSEAKLILDLYRKHKFTSFDYISITAPTREQQLSSDPDKQEHWQWFDGVPIFRFIMNNSTIDKVRDRVLDIMGV